MSRVGKNEIKIPSGVTWTQNGQTLSFSGKLGTESYDVPNGIKIEKTDAGFLLKPESMTRTLKALWGTTARNLSNVIKGVSAGFSVNIDLVGVGYRASVAGKNLNAQLGFSHDVVYAVPDKISIECAKPTSILVSGPSKQKVGQVAAFLCSHRPPEPYKGKGMHRPGRPVIRKEGKKK